MPPLYKIGYICVPPDKGAEAFGNITGSLNVQNVIASSLIFLRDSYPSGFPPMNIIPKREAEI
jgi:hypothetical protein